MPFILVLPIKPQSLAILFGLLVNPLLVLPYALLPLLILRSIKN